MVSPDAALKYLKPGDSAFSTDLLNFAREFVSPGMTVWDIGANVGVFTFAAAARTGPQGQVLAVEADRWLAGLLDRANHLNRDAGLQVQILAAAVSDRAGYARLHVAERGRASNWIDTATQRTTAGGTRKTNLVPTVTLDDLLDQGPAPDVIKMDIEGAEIMALQGGARLLAEARPVFYVEVGQEQREAVGKILTDAGYHLHDGDASAGSRPRLDHCAKNTLAIPSERSNENQN
ncbi:MAG: FkbM family methyltransferase [Phycisphaerales bacterium]|nr:FkbM family methyltransferase [Phycisphaerales bacterium]